ncbi:MAG: HEAT repeat domain-containing protein [Candidatus Omnitrophica bacterium]|nr:HEAT repeat domain-containing protein [Candidatus Omnitrophota bacterium]MBI3010015.1 HEAT repeat domain-containing protein [Candidatus Omnitrophota bacterium]
MEIDERHCPNCGHGIMDWDTVCPGCDQIPWQSPFGRKIIAQRRRWHWWMETGPFLAISILALGAATCGVISVMKSTGSVFCPLPGSDPKTKGLLTEIGELETQLKQPDLAANQREVAMARISELQTHGDYIIRQSATLALIEVLEAQVRPELPADQRETAITRISEFLEHDDHIIRMKAGTAIVDMLKIQLQQADLSSDRREAATTRLIQLLQHPSDLVRLDAALALGDTGDRRSIPVLINLLGEENETVQLLASASLEDLTGEQLGTSSKAWKRWWKVHQNDSTAFPSVRPSHNSSSAGVAQR